MRGRLRTQERVREFSTKNKADKPIRDLRNLEKQRQDISEIFTPLKKNQFKICLNHFEIEN